ncbi:hypothetical protein [Zunongwangia endophytica]|uniref:Uncharacterized protein n=1 Tax=Zunongwangia endophytica TaxID=1808945 RepID=A0ABV8HGS6_9FLAO|nr:hypothetical protein [Zunongwangia endophytica]MDN3593372.1 hypothetical protein [Zunongwangia endophytica]
MRKIILIYVFASFLIGCSNDQIESENFVKSDRILELTKADQKFDSWDDFYKRYYANSELNLQELETAFGYAIDTESPFSPALQAILGSDNQFLIGDKSFWVSDGVIYELDLNKDLLSQKQNKDELIAFGQINVESIPYEGSRSQTKSQMSITGEIDHYIWEFYREDYIDDCGNGVHKGPKSKKFKFVNELYSEHIRTGSVYGVHNYALWLRVKLEYNPRNNRWTGTTEGREIEISISDNSILRNNWGGTYPDTYTNHPYPYVLNWSSDCSSNQNFLLRTHTHAGPLIESETYWDTSCYGTITQKIIGDSSSNKWINNVSW